MTTAYLTLDAKLVRFDIEALMRAYPELQDDDDLRADVLEAETSLDETLTRLFLAMRRRQELAKGAKAISDDADARAKRFKGGADRLKDIILSLMDAAHLPKRELPVATLSVSQGRVRVVVDDVDALPQGAFTTVRKPIAAKELEALLVSLPFEEREAFPGARLEIGPDYLTARAK